MEAELVRRAANRLREVLPSFRDPSHYSNHEDHKLVSDLEEVAQQLEEQAQAELLDDGREGDDR